MAWLRSTLLLLFTIQLMPAFLGVAARPFGADGNLTITFERRSLLDTCDLSGLVTFESTPTGAILTGCPETGISGVIDPVASVTGYPCKQLPVTHGDAAGGNPAVATTCPTVTRTWTAKTCFDDPASSTTSSKTITAVYTLNPSDPSDPTTNPTVTISGTHTTTFACGTGLPSAPIDTCTAADHCTKSLTPSFSASSFKNDSSVTCQASATETCTATDCAGGSTTTTQSVTASPSDAYVKVTAPPADLSCCSGTSALTAASTCGGTTIASWLASAKVEANCLDSVAYLPGITTDFPSGGISATTTVTFSAINNCIQAPATATAKIKVCSCATCPLLRSFGYWGNKNGKAVCGTCSAGSTILTYCPATSSTACLCAAGSNSCQTQLAALYLDINCASASGEHGAGAAYILQTLKAKWPQCNYLTSDPSGTITPQQIYDQSVPLVTTKCSDIAGCIGGLLGYVDSATCDLSVVANTCA